VKLSNSDPKFMTGQSTLNSMSLYVKSDVPQHTKFGLWFDTLTLISARPMSATFEQ